MAKKLTDEEKSKVEAATANGRQALNTDDLDQMKTALEALTQANHALSSALYSSQSEPGAEAPAADATADGAAGAEGKDDVIDADFKDVNN